MQRSKIQTVNTWGPLLNQLQSSITRVAIVKPNETQGQKNEAGNGVYGKTPLLACHIGYNAYHAFITPSSLTKSKHKASWLDGSKASLLLKYFITHWKLITREEWGSKYKRKKERKCGNRYFWRWQQLPEITSEKFFRKKGLSFFLLFLLSSRYKHLWHGFFFISWVMCNALCFLI